MNTNGNDHDKGSDMPDQRRATPFYFDLNGRGNGNSVFIGPTRSGKTDYEKLKLAPAEFESIRGQGKEAA